MVELYIQNGGYSKPAIGGCNPNGKVVINGGNVTAIGNGEKCRAAIGGTCTEVKITGGTVKATSSLYSGISCNTGGNVDIIGGNLFLRGKNNLNIATLEEGTSKLIAYTPNNGTNNIYETQIKLQNIGENKKIESITTSDNIAYGVNDMYTLEDGMLYLYLPLGNREITIKVDGKTYKGQVETTEEQHSIILNQI